MPLQNVEHSKTEFTRSLVTALNEIINYCNDLERRLAEVEKKKNINTFNSGCSSCGKVLLDGKCLDCECSCRSYNNAGVSLCELHKKVHISKN